MRNKKNLTPEELKSLINSQATEKATKNILVDTFSSSLCILQNRGALEDCVAKSISNFFKTNPKIRNLEIRRHFYNTDSRTHFYVVAEDNHKLYGFQIYHNHFVLFSEAVKQNTVMALECEEDVFPRRTLGDVFDEWAVL